jgi:hypothetical protein
MRTMTTKTLSCLMIAAVLAGCTFPSLRVTDSPSASASDASAVSVTAKPAINGGAGLLLAPTAKRLVASSGSLRLAPTPVVRITP